MKILALSRKPRKFIPPSCKDMENPPEFSIKSLSKREHLKILSESNIKIPKQIKEGQDSIDMLGDTDVWAAIISNYDASMQILERGIVGWESLIDEAGDPVEFKRDNLELLHQDIIGELVAEITGTVTGEQAKNSEPPQSSQNGSETNEMKAVGNMTVPTV